MLIKILCQDDKAEGQVVTRLQLALEQVLLDEAGGFNCALVDPEMGDYAIEYVVDSEDIYWMRQGA